MADVPHSALSVAANGVVNAIDTHFRRNGAKVHVSTDTPLEGVKQASGDTNVINLFFYRVAPSGFHAAQTSNEPMMIRLYCLVTPFAAKNAGGGQGAPALGETDLRLLGEVLRLFHEHPILGPLSLANATAYALQAVLQAPEMEEINHIWTALGGTESYRPSAVYEFSLLPVDPAQAAAEAAPAYGFSHEIDPNLDRRRGPITPPPSLDSWSPALLLVDGSGDLSAESTLSWTQAQFNNNPADPIELALAGLIGRDAVLTWERLRDAAWELAKTGPVKTVQTVHISDPSARFKPAPPNIPEPQTLRITAVPADTNGDPIFGARPSNSLVLHVELV